jgi:HEAT repeat protein
MAGKGYGNDIGAWEEWWRSTRGPGEEQLQPLEASTPSGTLGILVAALDNRRLEANHLAIRALSGMGREATPALIDVLQSDNVYMKTGAAKALGQIGRDAAPAVEPLIKSLEVKNSNLRATAFRALGRIGTKPNLIVPALRDGLRSQWDFERIAAIQGLGELGPDAATALPDLRQLLQEPDVRQEQKRYLREAIEHAIDQIDVEKRRSTKDDSTHG